MYFFLSDIWCLYSKNRDKNMYSMRLYLMLVQVMYVGNEVYSAPKTRCYDNEGRKKETKLPIKNQAKLFPPHSLECQRVPLFLQDVRAS